MLCHTLLLNDCRTFFFFIGMSIAGHLYAHIILSVAATAGVVICFHFSLWTLPSFVSFGRIFSRRCAQFLRFCICFSSVWCMTVCVLCDCVIYSMLIVCFYMRNIKCRLRLKFTFSPKEALPSYYITEAVWCTLSHSPFLTLLAEFKFKLWFLKSSLHSFVHSFFFSLSLLPRTNFCSHFYFILFLLVSCLLEERQKQLQ